MTWWATNPAGPGPAGRRGGLAGVAAASLGAVATSLSIFLVGALAVQIRPALYLSLKGLGRARRWPNVGAPAVSRRTSR